MTASFEHDKREFIKLADAMDKAAQDGLDLIFT